MGNPVLMAILRRLVAVVFLLSVTGSGVLARQSGDIDVQIQVVPGPTPVDPVPWPEVPRPDASSTTVGTVTAMFSQVSVQTPYNRTDTIALDLVVLDERPDAPGWVITIAQDPDAAQDASSVLSRFLRRTDAISGQDVPMDQMPYGTRLSVGQPLARTTPVMEADPGTGMGAYWIRFAISGNPDLASASLIITLTTAP